MFRAGQVFLLLSLVLATGCSNETDIVDTREPAKIEGTINDFFQAPISGVKIVTSPVSETVYTDINGKFSIINLTAGNYKVYADKDGYRSEMASVSVKDKQVTNVQVILRKLVSISGKIIDDTTGEGLGNVRITVDKYSGQITTLGDGSFTLPNVAIGPSTTTFMKAGYCIMIQNFFIDINQSGGYEIRLSKLTPIEMAAVAAGSFQMGDSFGDGFINERPVHSVSLSAFFISKYEVTQKNWLETLGSNPAKFWGSDQPVESISWKDAVNFCNSRSSLEGLTQCYKTVNGIVSCDFNADGYRLPTEAEWEYAARGGSLGGSTKYSGGSDLKEVGWFYTYSENITHPVGTKKSNELGVYDMSGNVWEFCWDYFDANYYSASAMLNPTGPAQGSARVLRGGSWTDDAVFNRVFYRNYYSESSRGANVGFRMVRSMK